MKITPKQARQYTNFIFVKAMMLEGHSPCFMAKTLDVSRGTIYNNINGQRLWVKLIYKIRRS